MRRGCVLTIVVLSVIAFVISVLFYVFVWPETKKTATSDITYVIEDALEQYKADQGTYPADADNAAVVSALYGDNPRKKDYLVKMKSIIRDGQFTDYWKTPLRIELPEDGRASVLSAGPDRSFGSEDDITSELSRERWGKPIPAAPSDTPPTE